VPCRTANPTSLLCCVVGSASHLSATAIFRRLAITYFYGHPIPRTVGWCTRPGGNAELLGRPPTLFFSQDTRLLRRGRAPCPWFGNLRPQTYGHSIPLTKHLKSYGCRGVPEQYNLLSRAPTEFGNSDLPPVSMRGARGSDVPYLPVTDVSARHVQTWEEGG